MMNKTYTSALLIAAGIGFTALSIGEASAVKMRPCPDGSWVSDSEQCPEFKGLKKTKTISAGHLGLSGGTSTQQGQAPKSNTSTKKWRDFIFEGAKPPKPTPKP